MVGSGFAGSLLARILAGFGFAVALLERDAHPRFALGESSTPLGNLALERLARRYSLPDLHALAAHGRWVRRFPDLRRGLKRGFTFYRHRPGQPFRNGAGNPARLMVAASPDDEVADTHWFREDVDAHLVREAAAAGVDVRERTAVEGVEMSTRGARLRGRREGRGFDLAAEFVVDASGAGGVLAKRLPIPSALDRTATRSSLLFAHFAGVAPFAEVAGASGADLPAGPYPDDLAAVHHLLDEGWLYTLRFDHGTVSAGLLLRAGAVPPEVVAGPAAPALWRRLLSRYPTLQAGFAPAEPLFPIRGVARVQHRLARATGPRWVLMPHTFAFVDPLFSTGIAWSLLGVERLARCFEAAVGGGWSAAAAGLDRYAALLAAETDRVDLLIHGAYMALPDFDLFAAHAMTYFAAVSFAETRQRLLDGDDWAWEGFLGVGDPAFDGLFVESAARIEGATAGGRAAATAEARREFAAWVASAVAPRNVAGLCDPARNNLYPADPATLVAAADRLGLSADEVRRRLPRLRGS